MLLDVAFKRFFLLFILPFSLFAAKDPVGWSLSPVTGFPSVPVGSNASVTYTLTNNLPFPALIVTEHLSTNGIFSIHDYCNNITVAPNGTCIVHISFHPGYAGQATFQLIYGYHNNRIPLPVLTASGTGDTAGTVTGLFSDFPTFMTLSPPQSPSFLAIYTNNSSASVTGFAGNATDANILQISPAIATIGYSNNFCGLGTAPLALGVPSGSCNLTGTISLPTTTGTATTTGLYTYNTTNTVMPTGQTVITQGSGDCPLQTSVPIPLPKTAYPYSDNVVRFAFKNSCTSTSVTLGQVTVALASGNIVPATITTQASNTTYPTYPYYDTCSNQTLAGGASCFVIASVVPNTTTTGFLTVSAAVSNGAHTYKAHTGNNIVPLPGGTHTVYFQNECPFNVWYGIENGAPGSGITADPTPGAGNTGNDNAYLLSLAVSGHPQTTTNGERVLTVSSYVNGVIWGRTNCAYSGTAPNQQFACQTGMCTTEADSATCVISTSGGSTPSNPLTLAEFTISSTIGGDGVYDVSLENGFNLPIEIKALGPPVAGAPLTCNGAGAPLPSNTLYPNQLKLGSASWTMDPTVSPSSFPSADFMLVTPGSNTNCANTGACVTAGQACGMGFGQQNSSTFNNGTPINRLCGDFLGYFDFENYAPFSSSALWGGNPTYNMYTKYGMGNALPGAYGTDIATGLTASFGSMVLCQLTTTGALNTCYPNPGTTVFSSYPFSTCCGCVDWANAGLTYNAGDTCPITIQGQIAPVNTEWTATAGVPVSAGNSIYWLKLSCPTCYSFPYDDPSGSFTCTEDASSTAMYTSYQVTFCPGGITGLPTGITDGRCLPGTC